MARYQTIERFSQATGYTEKAIRAKIYDGTWELGKAWIKAPDNRVLISVEGYEEWVESGMESGEHPMWVAKQMGHSSWMMIAKVYGRYIPNDNDTSGSKAAELFGTPVQIPVEEPNARS